MPVDAIMVSAAVVSVFVAFAAVLIRGSYQTGPAQRQPANTSRKRRSF